MIKTAEDSYEDILAILTLPKESVNVIFVADSVLECNRLLMALRVRFSKEMELTQERSGKYRIGARGSLRFVGHNDVSFGSWDYAVFIYEEEIVIKPRSFGGVHYTEESYYT